MESMTVEKTVQLNLCTGCGVCSGICSKGCISWKFEKGLYLPRVDAQRCVRCGLCAQVCPGLGHTYSPKETALDAVTGPVLFSFNAWSRDAQLRHVSASGGVVSTLIRALLESGAYDGAFCVDSYDYHQQLKTRLYTAESMDIENSTPKSRYLPVSHEEAVSYIKNHREARIILIATSCALRGILSAIEKLKLSRDNYLLIGLFCDKIFNYHAIDYFEDAFCDGKPLAQLHFKNKESGGWPGDMKFFPKEGDPFFKSKKHRGDAKEYFMPERCLYCVDKLNVRADISLGDNYTGQDDSPLGSNSVIVRTDAGAAALEKAKAQLEIRSVSMEAIHQAQATQWRLNNLYFGDLKAAHCETDLELNRNIPREQDYRIFERAWRDGLRKLHAGESYDRQLRKLTARMERDKKKDHPITAFAMRCYYYVKRKFG